MDKSTSFEIRYQNKIGIITISHNTIKITVGNSEIFTINTDMTRLVDIPKKQNLILNWQQNNHTESLSIHSRYTINIKDAIISAYSQIIL